MSEPSTLVDALNRAHRELMRQDDSVVVLGEDVARNGGVFRVTEGLLEEFGPDRVMDTPLSEGGIVGSTVGMSAHGLRPIAEIQFSGFIHPAMDQIVSHLARLRTRSRGTYTCPAVIRAPYTGGIKPPEHHSESLEALYVHVPGLKVVTPSRPNDARNMLHGAVRDPDPVMFLEPKKIYRSVKEELPEDPNPIPPGTARRERTGEEVSIFSWGSMFQRVRRTLESLENAPSADLIDLRSLFPIDRQTIVESVRKTGRVLIVQEAPRTGGLASELTALINEQAFLYLEAPVHRVTGFDTVFPYPRLEDHYLPGEKRIQSALEKVISF